MNFLCMYYLYRVMRILFLSINPFARHIVSSSSGFRYNDLSWMLLHTARRIKEIAVYSIVFINRVCYCWRARQGQDPREASYGFIQALCAYCSSLSVKIFARYNQSLSRVEQQVWDTVVSRMKLRRYICITNNSDMSKAKISFSKIKPINSMR